MEHKLSATLELKDRFTAQIKSANDNLMKFKIGATKTGNAVKDTANCIKDSIGLLTKFAVVTGALKIGGAIFDFVKNIYVGYAELDQVLTKNKAIMGANIEESKLLKAQALELGKTMPFTAKEVAEAQKYQAMAGMKTNDVLALTPKLLKLSIASGEDLARTSDIMTDNLDAFGLKLTDADRLMDVMSATANNTNTSIGMLGEAYQYVAATSRNFDSFEEVNILLGVLANNGIKGAKAGRNLAAVYTRLANATPDMEKALQKVGLKLYDNNGKFKGLRTILEEVKPKLSKMTEEQRNYWLTTIAGTEGMKVFASILGYSKEGMDKVSGAINNSKGSIDKFYEEVKDTPANKIKALESAWEGLKLQIGEAAAPAITSLIEDLTKKIIQLSDSDTFSKENVESFFEAIKEGGKTAIDILDGVALALKPIVWAFEGLGLVAKTGRNLGVGLVTAYNEKQLDETTEIGEEYKAIAKINPQNADEEEKKKKRWMKNKLRENKFYNQMREIVNNKNSIYLMEDQFKYEGRDYKTKDTTDMNIIEEQYYTIGGGDKRYKKKPSVLDNTAKMEEKYNKAYSKLFPNHLANNYLKSNKLFENMQQPVNPPKKDNAKSISQNQKNQQQTTVTNNIEPKISVNLGGVTINNEMDKDKIKQLVSSELDNQFKQLDTYNQTTR